MRFLAFRRLNSEQGSGLIETTIAIALLAVIMGIVLTGLSTSYLSQGKNSEQAIAETLVRNQMEYTFSQPYSPPGVAYSTVATPQGFSVVGETLEYVAGDSNVEKIRVTVYHEDKQVLLVEALRSNY